MPKDQNYIAGNAKWIRIKMVSVNNESYYGEFKLLCINPGLVHSKYRTNEEPT